MSEVSSPVRTAALRTTAAAHLLAAFAVGCVALSAAFALRPGLPAPLSMSMGLDIVDVIPELIVLVAVALALVQPLRRFAWLVASVGLFGVAALYFQGDALERDELFVLVAVCTGLQLAGVLLAFADAERPQRWAIAVGFGAGAVAGKYGLALVILLVRESLVSGSMRGDDAIVALLGAVAAAAGVVLLLQSRPDSGAVESKPAAARGPFIWVLAAAAAAVVLSWLWQLVLEEVARSSTGGISQRRAEFVESMDQLARVAISVTVGVILLVAAYRRGGANLARWVVVAFGVAATSIAIPIVFRTSAGPFTETDLLVRLVVPAVIGAIAGAAAVRYVDRWFPWDALGIALGAAAVMLTSRRGQLELPDLAQPAMVLGTFGLALALTAGATRLTDPGARGLSTTEVSMSAGLGVAALVMCQQVISPVAYLAVEDLRGPQLSVPLTMAGAAVVLVVLFGLGRLVQRIRKDLVAEAAAGQG